MSRADTGEDGTREAAPEPAEPHGIESTYAWLRLCAGLALGTIGGVGMWSVVVALPAVQAEFGVPRGDASLPYALTMIGFGLGGILMGRLTDRFGIVLPVLIGVTSLALGYSLAAAATTLWQYTLVQGLLIGFGSSATFAPLLADSSHWFTRRRGIAMAVVASGNYLAGALWSPALQAFIEAVGWRQTYFGVAIFCLATMLPLVLVMRRRPPALPRAPVGASAASPWSRPLDLPPNLLQSLLMVAGVGCCVAMAMPQVHLVAMCTDLGYGAARGAQMLSLMLVCGVVSRLCFGFVSDRIGGLRTLLLGSGLQAVALALFLPFDGLATLFVLSALFGLFQGGIVPAYAIVVREYFPPHQAGVRVGLVLTATILGMALGGWMSGGIFDLTGSYDAAFVNGIVWNLVNLLIVLFLLRRAGPRGGTAAGRGRRESATRIAAAGVS